MLNWVSFRTAINAADLRVEHLRTLHAVEAWLDELEGGLRASLEQRCAAEPAALQYLRALNVVRLRMLREADIPPDESAARLASLRGAYDAGDVTEAQRLWLRRFDCSWVIGQSLVAKHPALAHPLSPAELERIKLLPELSAHAVEAWLDELEGALRASLEQRCAAEPAALQYLRALSVVRLRMLREADIPSDESVARLASLRGAYDAGDVTEAQRLWLRRLDCSRLISQSLVAEHPALAHPLSPAELERIKLLQELSELFPRLLASMARCGIGVVNLQRATELETVIGEYSVLLDKTDAQNPARTNAYDAMGQGALSLAKGFVLLGRYNDARVWFAQAATWFDAALEPENAKDCRTRSGAVDLDLAADLDSESEHELRIAADPKSEPFARAKALVRLAELVGKTSDAFEADRNAEAAVNQLKLAGFDDPESGALDVAVDSWITAAAAFATGTPFLQLIIQVATLFMSIITARHANNLLSNPSRADHLWALLREMPRVLDRFSAETSAAQAELSEQWSKYFPQAVEVDKKDVDEEARCRSQTQSQLIQEVLDLQAQCNARLEAGQPQDDLVIRAEELVARADVTSLRFIRAFARRMHAYVLLHGNRAADCLQVLDTARDILLNGRPAALASFSDAAEREVYLTLAQYRAQAQTILGDFAGLLAACEAAVRDIETARVRVNTPFQQSAFLAGSVIFYTMGAFAAWKLERWDALLGFMELVKARAALRNKLAAEESGPAERELSEAFEAASRELDGAAPGSNEANAAAERRRQLWSLLAIARARRIAGKDVPELSIAAIKAALAPDEAAISWLWIGSNVLLLLAIDHQRPHVERIVLSDKDRRQLDNYLSTVQALHSPHLSMAKGIEKLGQALLPPACRDFIADKKRLILSPHRTLHLIPFHAARWERGFLIERFAVRYVPNLGSLALPWSGCRDGGTLAVGIVSFKKQAGLPPLRDLPDAEKEVAEIRELASSVVTLTGERATRAAFTALPLGEFRCIHFATHGSSVFDGDAVNEPLESKIFFYDGALDGMTVARVGLRAELVVLSACHSGQRAIGGRGLKELPGDDIFGLQAALFQSGVRSIIGALWPVADESAPVILPAFHRHYQTGLTPEVALQAALRDYLADPERFEWAHDVFYWAPFFMTSLGSMTD